VDSQSISKGIKQTLLILLTLTEAFRIVNKYPTEQRSEITIETVNPTIYDPKDQANLPFSFFRQSAF